MLRSLRLESRSNSQHLDFLIYWQRGIIVLCTLVLMMLSIVPKLSSRLVIVAASPLFSLFLSHLPVFTNISVSHCLLDSYVKKANLSPFRPPVYSIHVKIRRTHTRYKVQVKVPCGRVRSVPSTAVPNATRLIKAGVLTRTGRVVSSAELPHSFIDGRPKTAARWREKRLRDDPLADLLGPLFVGCKRCDTRIKLSPKSSYNPFHWVKHRKRCLQKIGRHSEGILRERGIRRTPLMPSQPSEMIPGLIVPCRPRHLPLYQHCRHCYKNALALAQTKMSLSGFRCCATCRMLGDVERQLLLVSCQTRWWEVRKHVACAIIASLFGYSSTTNARLLSTLQ